MRWLLLLFFAVPAYAQHFDLTEMPAGYTFTLNEHDGHSVVTYIGPQDDRFVFQYETDDGVNPVRVTTSWANRASQLVEFSRGGDGGYIVPHDCWPQKGSCKYMVRYYDGETLRMRSEIYVRNGVWFHERFVDGNTGWQLYERGCATIDEYGFPIDLYIDYGDGEVEWSTRETTQGVPDSRANFDALKAICQPADEVTS